MNSVNSTSFKTMQTKDSNKSKGTLKAVVLSQIAPIILQPALSYGVKGALATSQKLSKDEINLVNKAQDKILVSVKNLKNKGVKIADIKEKSNDIILNTVAQGKNTFFVSGKGEFHNSILVNRDKLSLLTFHEIGHAFNFNNSAFWKTVQKSRNSSKFLASVIALMPAFTTDIKPKDGEELTKGQKIKNSFRKASPVLAFGVMVPTLAEEALASIRGCKWAKNMLDKNLYKQVVKTNLIAYSTYIISALALSVTAICAKKVKDKAQEQANSKEKA